MTPQVQALAQELKAALLELYGSELAALILYGSQARGDFHDESDVDFAVVLKDSVVSSYAEVSRIAPISVELDLKYSALTSILPVSEHKLSTSTQPVYQEIRREGIRI